MAAVCLVATVVAGADRGARPACGRRRRRAGRAGDAAVVVFLGTSLTAGLGLDPDPGLSRR